MTTTMWLTGLPSSGKTTLAREFARRQGPYRAVEHLDGDEIRADLFPELGFEQRDREENIRRVGRIATMLAAHGVLVVVSVIAPYRQARDRVRAEHARRGLTFLEVHVDAPLEVCADRDVKGLYARSEQRLTGVRDVYEPPEAPELRLETATNGIDECIRLMEKLLAAEEPAAPRATEGT